MRTGAGFDSALAWAQRRPVKSPASDMKANTLFISIPRVDVRHIEYSGVDTRPRLNEVLGSIDHERHPLCGSACWRSAPLSAGAREARSINRCLFF